MARIKLGSIVTDISGSVGGHTFQRDHYGLSLRSKPIPGHVSSQFQSVIRNRLTYLQSLWIDLSADDRLKWTHSVDWSNQSTKHSPKTLLSGYNLFVKYQSARLMAGLPVLTTISYHALNQNLPEFSLKRSVPSFYLYFSDPVYSTDSFFNVFLSLPVHSGNAYRNNGLRYVYVPPADANIFYITNQYLSIFNQLPDVDQQLNYRIYFWGINSPILGLYRTGTKIIETG